MNALGNPVFLGVVAGDSHPSLGLMLRLIDAVARKHTLPIETRTLSERTPPGADTGCAGYLFGALVDREGWLRKLAAPADLIESAVAILPTAGERHGKAVFISPRRVFSRLHASAGAPGESWVETSVVSRPAIETALAAARDVRNEFGLPVIWVNFDEHLPGEPMSTESFAIDSLRDEHDFDLQLTSPATFWFRAEAAGREGGFVAAGVSPLMPSLARLFGADGRLSWSPRGVFYAQPFASELGASGIPGAMTTAWVLGRLGFVREAAELETVLLSLSAEARKETRSYGIDAAIERLK